MKKDTFLLKISVSHSIGEEGKTEYVTRNTLTRNLRSRKQNRCGRRLIKDLGERLTMKETDRNGFNKVRNFVPIHLSPLPRPVNDFERKTSRNRKLECI